jgi:magnesium-transporting ATPase (P-type)
MMEQELDDSEPPTIKLGDASVAAPFTSKLANVIAIPNILRQGRCTLVATIQMYKILALNCLISAYSLSVIYLEGIKFGDGQVTISGMLMSVCFLSISRAKVRMPVPFLKMFCPNTSLVCRRSLQGTPTAKHLQCLHHWFCPWPVCHPYCDTDLPIKLCLQD